MATRKQGRPKGCGDEAQSGSLTFRVVKSLSTGKSSYLFDINDINPTISANFHDGAVVANFPYENYPGGGSSIKKLLLSQFAFMHEFSMASQRKRVDS